MSASVPRDLASTSPTPPVVVRHTRSPILTRLWLRVDRSIWPADRPLAEARWAAVALGLTLAMALPAALFADPDGNYGRAVVVTAVSLALAIGVAWSPFAVRLAHHPMFRRSIGPLVVLAALTAAGVHDPATLEAPQGRPFIILAVTYAALTPGFWLAVGVVAVASVGLLIDHAALNAHDLLDVHAIDFTVRVTVTLLGAIVMHAVDRGLRRERQRSEALTAGRVAKADQLEDLQRILRRFDGTRPVEAVMQDVVDDVAEAFGLTLVSAYLPDARGRLSMVGVAGYDDPHHVIEPGVGVVGRAAQTKKTIVLTDVLADPGYRAARADVRSEVAVPILHGDEVLGILNFEGTLDKPITPAHVAVAEMLAQSIVGALRSARLDDERRHRLHAIERVLEVSRSLTSDLDRPRVVASVVDAARDLLDVDTIEFASLSDDGRFRVELAVGTASDRPGSVIIAGEGLSGEVIASGDRVVWSGPHRDRVGLGFPIRSGGTPSAVLAVTRERVDRPFTELELRIADLLVTQIEAALHNADLHARVSEAAVRDPLTGLLNRRYFDEAVETAFAAAARNETDVSLVVLDLDRFSEVNNVHGHAVGDAVLRRVARAMVRVVRTGDILARYGGEEFVVIAPGTDAAGAVKLAERIRASVAADGARPIDGLVVPVTVSAGVASRLGDEADGRALFRAADSALLAAKRAGRDRVVSL